MKIDKVKHFFITKKKNIRKIVNKKKIIKSLNWGMQNIVLKEKTSPLTQLDSLRADNVL